MGADREHDRSRKLRTRGGGGGVNSIRGTSYFELLHLLYEYMMYPRGRYPANPPSTLFSSSNVLSKMSASSEERDEQAPKDEPLSPCLEERAALIESRVLGVEQLCGLPNPTAPRGERIRSFFVFQVHHKLLLFGKAALPIAIIVLLANIGFVVGLSIYQMRNTCIPNMSLIDGDLPGGINQLMFRDSGNIFICTSAYNNLVREDDTSSTNNDPCSSLNWSPCTLAGLSMADYDLKQSICPVAFNGCYRPPSCLPSNMTIVNEQADVLSMANAGMVEVCDSYGWEEQICEGVVSLTYWACPNAWTTIGAALGYSAIVQLVTVVVVLVLYLGIHFLCTGECYSLSDITKAWGRPGSTIEEVRASFPSNV